MPLEGKVAVDPSAGTKETPTPLRSGERAIAALLVVAGIAVVTVVLSVFLTEGEWLTEQTTTTGAGPQKEVQTDKYTDTLPLAALGVGGLLVLCGAFFGRLREITLPGGASLKLGDAKQRVDKSIEAKVDEKVKGGEVDPNKIGELKELARKDATVELLEKVSTTGVVPDPEQIATKVVERAKQKV